MFVNQVIFMPGTLLNERSFEAVASRLFAAGIRTRTVVLGEEITLSEECRRIAESTSYDEVWIGHSLGGIAALQLARLRPRSCAALVTLASTARADAPENTPKRRNQLRMAESAGSPRPVSLEMKPVFGLLPGQALSQSLQTQADEVGLHRFRNQTTYAIERTDQRASTQALGCPILALSGAVDDICRPELSDEIAALSPQGIHRSVSGAGHLLPMTHANEIAAHIIDFLSTLTFPIKHNENIL